MSPEEVATREPVPYPSPTGGWMYGWIARGQTNGHIPAFADAACRWNAGEWRDVPNGLPLDVLNRLPKPHGRAGGAVCYPSPAAARGALAAAVSSRSKI